MRWAAVDRDSGVAARMRRAWRRPGGPASLLLVLFGAAVFTLVAAGVPGRDATDLGPRLDREAREVARGLVARSGIRAAAAWVSRLTGEGLVVGVAAGAAGLLVARRRRDAVVFVGGVLSAWALAALLKLAFRASRPKPRTPAHAITGYGFPSSHALVTLVACGLIAWLLGRHASAGTRLLLGAGALITAGLAAVARVVLNAHWLSDVAAGLAAGTLWLGLVTLAASAAEARES